MWLLFEFYLSTDIDNIILYSKTKELLNNFKKNAKENVDEKKT